MALRGTDTLFSSGRWMCLGTALMILVASTSCSIALDLSACASDDDCDEGYACTQEQICLDSSAQCESDDQCLELFGAGASCSDGICKGDNPLTGGPCQQLYGSTGDDAFLIGVVMQLSGVGGGFGQPMLDAIRIAKRDINAIGGVDGTPIGLIACDTADTSINPEDFGEDAGDTSLDTIARIGARHLVEEADVEVVMGLNSSQVIDIGPTITAPNDVLLMSPSATAATIPPSGHDGLIWRTAPSDEPQAIALSGLIEHSVDTYLPNQGVETPKVTVLVREEDRWAEGLFDHLLSELPSELTGGGSDRFSFHYFPNVGAGDVADYTPIAAEVAAESVAPDVVVVLGSADSWQLIGHLDNALEGDPLFIGGDAMKNVQEASQAPAELEHRIWGTGPRSVAEFDYQPYTIFRLKFEQEMNDNANNYQFVANAFDALYTVAFGAAAEGLTGRQIATGLSRLDRGEDIFPSSTDAQKAITILSDGGTINYHGASGPINFDDRGDPEPMPIALWCFEDGQVPERGQLYSQEQGVFTALTCDPQDSGGDANFDDPEMPNGAD